ncbi:MAG TPA: hypothetical protein DEF45_23860, partial [Rhodopirellula sp.]|nr:hypothetical protein [Rhodopirellula sp.]
KQHQKKTTGYQEHWHHWHLRWQHEAQQANKPTRHQHREKSKYQTNEGWNFNERKTQHWDFALAGTLPVQPHNFRRDLHYFPTSKRTMKFVGPHRAANDVCIPWAYRTSYLNSSLLDASQRSRQPKPLPRTDPKSAYRVSLLKLAGRSHNQSACEPMWALYCIMLLGNSHVRSDPRSH